jgi:YVTN family beta-propeller protein
MFAYPNNGTRLDIIDYETFEVVGKSSIDVPDDFQLFAISLSTERDYFIFNGHQITSSSTSNHFIISYDIDKMAVHSQFATGLTTVGAPRLAPAMNLAEPGLYYLYTHTYGLFDFDFLEQRLISTISSEHDQSLGKEISHSPDNEYTVIRKTFGGLAYSELEFYNTADGLYSPIFVLNQADRDSINIYDNVFSADGTVLYISFQLSRSRSREIASYFGSYNLETKQLFQAPLTFPWSLNPYFLDYNPQRNEVYMIGAEDQFYIIDSEDYSLKSTITLAGKIPGATPIFVRPDGDVAFVSSWRNDLIFVIDLVNREVIKKIDVERPYKMIIP